MVLYLDRLCSGNKTGLNKIRNIEIMLFADSGIKEEINKITRNPQKLWKSNESFYVVIGSKKKSEEKLESVWIAW